MDLSELINIHRGARTYAELARDCGGSPTDKRLQQLVRQQIKNFPDPPTVRALARGLRVPESAVVLAAAESLGLDAGRSMPRIIELLPSGAEDLSEEQAAAVAHLVRTILDDPRRVRPQAGKVEAGAGPEPTVAGVMRARAESGPRDLMEGSGKTGSIVAAEQLLEPRGIQSGPRHGLEDLDDPSLTRTERLQILARAGMTADNAEVALGAMDRAAVAGSRKSTHASRGTKLEEALTAAARHGRSVGRQARAEQDVAGEENQDKGTSDPA